MRRIPAYLLLLSIILIVSVEGVGATLDEQPRHLALKPLWSTGRGCSSPPDYPPGQVPQAAITSPRMNAVLRGRVEIKGSASIPNFWYYKVEYGYGADPLSWALVDGETHPTEVIDGVLAIWDTTTVPDGTYSLRLRVVYRDGNYEEAFVRQVVVANAEPTETPTPTVTPTSTPTPVATPTVAIIQPTIPPTPTPVPTPTPLPGRPEPGMLRIPTIDVKGLGQAFCFGATAAGALFLLFGVIALLRRW